jgi:alcohol dehydrogenase/L-iditol 2-dehydrogenase
MHKKQSAQKTYKLMSSSTKSAAVVNYSEVKGSVEIREIPIPNIGEEDVLLEVENVGVCGSDLHQWTSDHSWQVNYPVVLGHEFGGKIAALGARVSGWKLVKLPRLLTCKTQ